ncbi:MAG TPA: DUF5676 family membrane protein [Candidatus Nanoarchaeia archaeon]|nr:DUF5676 family membrane protein [Candidatus Nanoarchaeia archaeon]
MEKLKPNVVALSLGLTSVILYLLCLIFVSVIPIGMMGAFVNNLQHSMDFTGMMTQNINFIGSLVGIIGWFIISAISGYIFAVAYNWTAEKLR